MLVAKDFVILRDVEAHGLKQVAVEREPLRLYTLINETRFNASGHALIHMDTVFVEDRGHDWEWREGKMRYFSRVTERADVLLVYEQVKETQFNFCPTCGTPIAQGCEHHPKQGQPS